MRLSNKMIAEYRDLFHARDLLAKSLVSVYCHDPSTEICIRSMTANSWSCLSFG